MHREPELARRLERKGGVSKAHILAELRTWMCQEARRQYDHGT